jgi:septum formation protein
MKTLILASQSPRRRELLERCQIPFICEPADIDESLDLTRPLTEEIERLSRQKAEHVLQKHPDAVVIGSDTLVAVDGKPLGKPHSEEEAGMMLAALQGRTHQVITGLAVISTQRQYLSHETAEVVFEAMDHAEIMKYVATGECMDKAGAYGIQGYGGRYVKEIHGDFYAIMGLPLHLLYRELKNLSMY